MDLFQHQRRQMTEKMRHLIHHHHHHRLVHSSDSKSHFKTILNGIA